MSGIQMCLLLLVLCPGNSDAWFWYSNVEPTTEPPTDGVTTGATAAMANATANGTKEEREDDELSGLGEEIINVATGIREFVEAWDATPTARTASGGLTETVESANATGNASRFRGERGEEVGDVSGSGSGSGADSVMVSGDKVLPSNFSVSEINGTLDPDPPCLSVPSDWSICSGKRSPFFTLPNFFNHTSVEEVGAVLQEWAWLTRKGCHHSAEWFLCLLLAPRCPAPAAPPRLPCRSFCHVLQDSCWASLEDGRLPVECHLLPEEAQQRGRPACVSVSNRKGNPGGLECIRPGNTF